VREAGDEPLVDRLVASLRDKHLLLILDNFEHVVEAAPIVADLLGGCPNVTVLVTSRVRLRLAGEREHAVPPLGLAEQYGGTRGDDAAAAVRLFVARAQAIAEDFALTPESAPIVLAICRRLDGLPLAIELAAARIKVIPPGALLARLDRRLPLLTGGPRDSPARQQTMRDAISWSYDLLEPPEQALFRHLAVFVGGVTLEAAETVCSGVGEPNHGILDGLASLVDNSLVRQAEGSDGQQRFVMLETIREYGLEQLEARGEADEGFQRHVDWCLGLAERNWGTVVLGPVRAAWLDQLTAEHDNLRAALGRLELEGDAETGLRLAGSLSPFWVFRGHLNEGRGWLDRALLGGGTAPAHVRARALFGLGRIAHQQGDYGQATELLRECFSLFQEAGDRLSSMIPLLRLGTTATAQGLYERAEPVVAEALAMAQASGQSD
jgi:predicted ATPase